MLPTSLSLQHISVLVIIILSFTFRPVLALETNTLTEAARLFCNALKNGQSPASAQEIATDFVLQNLDKKAKPNPSSIHAQIRAEVLQQCPNQAQKVKK